MYAREAIEYADMTYVIVLLRVWYYYSLQRQVKTGFRVCLKKSKGAENQNANEFGVFFGTIVYAYINS